MKVIIAGSRTIFAYGQVSRAIQESGFADHVTEVVCGMAQGVDLLGMRWAGINRVRVKEMPVTDDEVRVLGKRALKARNTRMIEYADALLLVWDGVSPGSADLLDKARERHLPIFQRIVKKKEAE